MSPFTHVDMDNFDQQVLKANHPVVLEFGATWCQPCKRLEPEMEKLAAKWPGRIEIAKLDVDQCADLTVQYQIMSVPTVIFFAQGQPLVRLTGFQPLVKLVEKIEPHLQEWERNNFRGH